MDEHCLYAERGRNLVIGSDTVADIKELFWYEMRIERKPHLVCSAIRLRRLLGRDAMSEILGSETERGELLQCLWKIRSSNQVQPFVRSPDLGKKFIFVWIRMKIN